MNKEVWWSSLEETGLEHLNFRRDGRSFIGESIILRVRNDRPFHFRYRILCDGAWRVREVETELRSPEKRRIGLFADGAGNWTDAETGRELPEFAGCFEVDISATPFTNTLPVKRAGLKTGESAEIAVVYFLIPEMTVRRSEQRYTALGTNFYRFEENGLFDGFSAELRFDDDGLVIDYPDLFRRLEKSNRGRGK